MARVVARTLNFTRAAEEVHIAQPPLSRQIANLEDEVGIKLFDRDPRGLRLTPAGVFFGARAEEIVDRIDRLKRETAALAADARQTFRIGVVPSLLYGRTRLGLAFIRRSRPNLEIDLTVHSPHELLEALRRGHVDLAVGREFVTRPS